MENIVASALEGLLRRAKKCLKASTGPNVMADQGWSVARNKAYWLAEYYKAIYRRERIMQRFATK